MSVAEVTILEEATLRISIAGQPEVVHQLRSDLDQEVGPADFDSSPDIAPNAKGGAELAGILVAVLGTPAVAALVGVLKAYFDRTQMTELDITGPGGAIKLKLPAGTQIGREEIQAAIDKVLKTSGD